MTRRDERKMKKTIKGSGITVVRAGREKNRGRKKRKRKEKMAAAERVPDALSGFVCDLHSQKPDPSVFLFDVSHIGAIPLAHNCPI